jgi:hypothetical protein
MNFISYEVKVLSLLISINAFWFLDKIYIKHSEVEFQFFLNYTLIILAL